MRRLPLALLLVAACLAALPLLRADDAGAPPAGRVGMELPDRVLALELELSYLRLREDAVSAYVLANGARAEAIDRMANQMTQLGFAQKAMPAESREALLAGLRALAADLREGLPHATPAEMLALDTLRRHLAARR